MGGTGRIGVYLYMQMRGAAIAIVSAGLTVACGQPDTAFPQPVPLPFEHSVGAFPIKSRPGCTPEVIAAARNVEAIRRLNARGATFTCGPASEPLLLDEAITMDSLDVVRALLEAHADPNARWTEEGDRFPLEEAIEARSYGIARTHRVQIIRLLLDHGADPNARWCLFESRQSNDGMKGCTSAEGVSSLTLSAAGGDIEVVRMLLDAGADRTVRDASSRTAEAWARKLGHNDIAKLLSQRP